MRERVLRFRSALPDSNGKNGTFDIIAMLFGRNNPGQISQIYRVGEKFDKANRFTLVNTIVNSDGVCDIA